ncbi:MAG: cellulase family glycosylhydrolase [Hyphomonadaceae bacterium]|nr:cellulase family glycosylhydrolase [Hyphomonadaceae bacterium]
MDQERILRVTGACGAILALALGLAAVAALAEPPRALADFDQTQGQWSFHDGAEFPGGSGAFTIGHGLHGHGGRLDYAFTCVQPNQCGAYVSAELRLDPAAPTREGDVLAFAISPPADSDIAVRLIDGTGQTLQFGLSNTTLEHQAADGWRQMVLRLDREAPEHWGGADDGFVREGIQRIAFLARGRAPQRGAVLIDDVRIVNAREQAYVLPERAPRAAHVAPTNAPILGVNMHNRHDIAALDAARAVGVQLVRTDLFWTQVETNGAYDFSSFDELVGALDARDMRALLILDYGHPDHGGGGAVIEDEDRAAYVAYAGAAAAHFRGEPVIFEIWNEPDTGSYRRFEPDQYARLARETVRGVRSVDRRAEIISGGLSWANHDYFGEMLEGLDRAPLNAIAIHPYRPGGPESAAQDFPELRSAIANQMNAHTPLWVTEWGYSSVIGGGDGRAAPGRRRQGIMLARQMLTLWALRAPLTVWYEWRDRNPENAPNWPTEGEFNFGVVDAEGNPKPAHEAMRTFSGIAAGRRLTAVLQDLPPLAHAIRLEGRQDAVYAVWTEALGGRVVVTAPRNVLSVQNAFGAPLAYDGERRIVVTEAEGPVYIRVRR